MSELNDLIRFGGFCLVAREIKRNGFDLYEIRKIDDDGTESQLRTFFSEQKTITELERTVAKLRKSDSKELARVMKMAAATLEEEEIEIDY